MQAFFFTLFFLASCNARSISWTNAGGNPLWNNAANWDCSCLPTLADDVIVDINSITGNVIIGSSAPALCYSLTIGGSSSHSQTVTVTTDLKIGGGKSTINSNGAIILKSGSTAGVTLEGSLSVHGAGFSWVSGNIMGNGSYALSSDATLNLTGAASRLLRSKIMIAGKVITDTDQSTYINIGKGGALTVSGSFVTSKSLTVGITDDSASFSVTGSLSFGGAELELQGPGISVANLALGQGSTATISNGLTAGNVKMAQGSTLVLIGGPTDKRSFKSVTGSGIVKQSGGVDTFGALSCAKLSSTGGNISITKGSVSDFSLDGAFVSGGYLESTSASFYQGSLFGGINVVVGKFYIEGVVTVDGDGTTLSITGSASNTKYSQLTLVGGSSFKVGANVSVSQNGEFQVVPGAKAASSPTITMSGHWSCSARLTISLIPVSGEGSYSLSPACALQLNSVAFSGSNLNSAGLVALSAGQISFTKITGTGSFSGNPFSFNAKSIVASKLTLDSGAATFGAANISSLFINNGVLTVSAAALKSFTFSGGTLAGSASGTAVHVSGTTLISGTSAQTLKNVQVLSGNIDLECLQTGCQLFSDHSSLSTI